MARVRLQAEEKGKQINIIQKKLSNGTEPSSAKAEADKGHKR